MNNLLAETIQGSGGEVVSIHLLTVIITTVVTAILGATGGALVTRRSGNARAAGQPAVTVELLESMVTKSEMTALEERIERKLVDLKSTLTEDRTTAKTTSDQTFHRINAISREIAENSGELKQVNANIERLYQQITGRQRPRSA